MFSNLVNINYLSVASIWISLVINGAQRLRMRCLLLPYKRQEMHNGQETSYRQHCSLRRGNQRRRTSRGESNSKIITPAQTFLWSLYIWPLLDVFSCIFQRHLNMHWVDLDGAKTPERGNLNMHVHVLFPKNTHCRGGVQKTDGVA